MILSRRNQSWPLALKGVLVGLVLVHFVMTLQVAYAVFIADAAAQGGTPHNLYMAALYASSSLALVAGIAGKRRLFVRSVSAAAGLNVFVCTIGVILGLRAIAQMYCLAGGLGTWLGEVSPLMGWNFTCLIVSALGLITVVRSEWRTPGASR